MHAECAAKQSIMTAKKLCCESEKFIADIKVKFAVELCTVTPYCCFKC